MIELSFLKEYRWYLFNTSRYLVECDRLWQHDYLGEHLQNFIFDLGHLVHSSNI